MISFVAPSEKVTLRESQRNRSTSLETASQNFDITLFGNQSYKDKTESDMSHVAIFQRFCVLMLLLKGRLEDQTDPDFLRELNVYTEIRNIKQTVK